MNVSDFGACYAKVKTDSDFGINVEFEEEGDGYANYVDVHLCPDTALLLAEHMIATVRKQNIEFRAKHPNGKVTDWPGWLARFEKAVAL